MITHDLIDSFLALFIMVLIPGMDANGFVNVTAPSLKLTFSPLKIDGWIVSGANC